MWVDDSQKPKLWSQTWRLPALVVPIALRGCSFCSRCDVCCSTWSTIRAAAGAVSAEAKSSLCEVQVGQGGDEPSIPLLLLCSFFVVGVHAEPAALKKMNKKGRAANKKGACETDQQGSEHPRTRDAGLHLPLPIYTQAGRWRRITSGRLKMCCQETAENAVENLLLYTRPAVSCGYHHSLRPGSWDRPLCGQLHNTA